IQDSMMIAEVGGMLKVSGSRMATPLAPPSPGSTPMSTPSVIPMNMYMMFIGSPRTPKPSINELSASTKVRSEEHTSELQSLMRLTYAHFCWKKNNTTDHI